MPSGATQRIPLARNDIVEPNDKARWVGGQSIRLTLPDNAHEDGSIMIELPRQRTLMVANRGAPRTMRLVKRTAEALPRTV